MITILHRSPPIPLGHGEGISGLRDAIAVVDEMTVTEGWLRIQWDGFLEVGKHRDVKKSRFWQKRLGHFFSAVLVLYELLLYRRRIRIEMLGGLLFAEPKPWVWRVLGLES